MATATESLVVELDAKIDGYIDGMNKAEKKGKHTSNAITKGMKKAGLATAGMGKAAIGAAKALSVAVAATTALTAAIAANAKEVQINADLTGVSVEKMQLLASASGTVGISLEKMGDISKDTREKLGEFVEDGTGGFNDFISVAGLGKEEAKDLAKEFQTMSGDQVLGAMVKRMEDAGASTQSMSWALESVGSDATKLLPLLRNNSEELNKLQKHAAEVNVVLSQTDIDTLTDMSKGFSSLYTNFQNTFGVMAVEFADTFNSMINSTNEGLKIIGDDIASGAFTDRMNAFYNMFAAGWGETFDSIIGDWDMTGTEFVEGIARMELSYIEFLATLPISMKQAANWVKELWFDMVDEIEIKFAESQVAIAKLNPFGDEELAQANLAIVQQQVDARDAQNEKLMSQLADEKQAIIDKMMTEIEAAEITRDTYAAGTEDRLKQIEAVNQAERKLAITSKATARKKIQDDKDAGANKLTENEKIMKGMDALSAHSKEVALIENGIQLPVAIGKAYDELGPIGGSFATAGLILTFAGLAADIAGAGSGGGGSSSGGGAGAESYQAPTTTVESTGQVVTDSGVGQMTIKVTSDDGDELGKAFANVMNSAQIDGRYA